MSKILEQLPYADTAGMVSVQGEQIPVVAHQIIVWVSVSVTDVPRLGADAPRVPAVFDTGNSFGFSIPEDLLVRWCGLRPELLEPLGPVFINRRRLPRYAADIWLHRNRRGRRDTFRDESPFRLQLRDGIAIYPGDRPDLAPRLPLLRLRAIDDNGLRCTVNGRRRAVSVSTAGPT